MWICGNGSNIMCLANDLVLTKSAFSPRPESGLAGVLDSQTCQWTNDVSLLGLPLELIEEILLYCIRPTLLSMCHVSRFLNHVATRELYHIVRWTSSRQAVLCSHTLLRNEFKAAAVKVLFIGRQ
jgi:hypothetical protein